MNNELFNKFYIKIAPVVENDQYVIDYVRKNNFNKKNYDDVILWFVNATILVLLRDAWRPENGQLIKECKYDMPILIKRLVRAGFSRVGDDLFDIYEMCIDDWVRDLQDQFEDWELDL